MKIVFMGSSNESADVLSHLIEGKRDIAAVVTQPDKRKGRGLKTSKNVVAEIAEEHGIALIKPDRLNDDIIGQILSFAPDLIIVVAYGKLLPKRLLDAPRFGSINLHASLLPFYRGASPIQSAILCGDRETGVTVMRINEKLDEGDIIFQEKLSIADSDDSLTLSGKIFASGMILLDKTIDSLEESGSLPNTKQDNSAATYCRMIKKADGLVDFNSKAKEILNKVRAFTPWPGAYWIYKGKTVKITSAESSADGPREAAPGTVINIQKGRGFLVAARDGCILIKEVQPENSKKMSADEFVNGYRIRIGERIF